MQVPASRFRAEHPPRPGSWRNAALRMARAYKQLQPAELKLETTSDIHEDNRMPRAASNDFVVVQFHPDFEALKLPDCNPVPIPGFKR